MAQIKFLIARYVWDVVLRFRALGFATDAWAGPRQEQDAWRRAPRGFMGVVMG